jgi:putative transposase
VTKYRNQVLFEDIGYKARELVRQTYHVFGIEILKVVVSKDHVHLFVSAPLNMSPSEIMPRIKGRSYSKLFESFPELRKRFWCRNFWARGYFCVTAGELTEEKIKDYLEHHFEPMVDDNFRTEGPLCQDR